MTFTDCQRAKCGAKNIFMAHIYLKWLNYFSAVVEDQSSSIITDIQNRKVIPPCFYDGGSYIDQLAKEGIVGRSRVT